jgi:MarR family transcriptional regulator, transcriptional regulator for hemolysin
MPNIMDNPFKSISILYRKSHIWLNDGCVQYALTAAQAVVILIVCDFEVLTQDGITKRLGLDKSVIAKTVTKLEEIGFMVRTTNAKDKRTYDIRPTEKAWEVYPFVKEQMDVCFQRMTKQMTDTERAEFKRLLLLAAEASIDLDD